jgi:hypothetical protein
MILVWYGSINGLWPSLSPGMPWVHRAGADASWPFLCVLARCSVSCPAPAGLRRRVRLVYTVRPPVFRAGLQSAGFWTSYFRPVYRLF